MIDVKKVLSALAGMKLKVEDVATSPFDFTAPRDGLLVFNGSSESLGSATSWYWYISNGTTVVGGSTGITNGGKITFSYAVKKGEHLTGTSHYAHINSIRFISYGAD